MPHPFNPSEELVDEQPEELEFPDTWSTLLEPGDYVLRMIREAKDITEIEAAHGYAEEKGFLNVSSESATVIYEALMKGAYDYGYLQKTIEYFKSAEEKGVAGASTREMMSKLKIHDLRSTTRPVLTSYAKTQQRLEAEQEKRRAWQKRTAVNKENNPRPLPSVNTSRPLPPLGVSERDRLREKALREHRANIHMPEVSYEQPGIKFR